MEKFDVSLLPTIDLGGIIVYDAFVMRALCGELRAKQMMLPQELVGGEVYKLFGQLLSQNEFMERSAIDTIGKTIWPLFVKHPPAPLAKNSDYVAAVWRYLLVPTALVSVRVCLDYWTSRNLRDLNWYEINGQYFAYGSPHPTVHAEEYVRAKQVLFEALGPTEGAKYANALASRRSPQMWIKQLRKREQKTAHTMSNLGFQYNGLVHKPLTVANNDDRLTVWLLDNHLRHPSGPYLPGLKEPTFIDYGAASATTYALMLTLLYNDTTGRIANILPNLD